MKKISPESNKISIAIDLSYSPARVALSNELSNEKKIIEYENFEIRTGADLLNWISAILKENHLEFCEIRKWTMGSGPGAFSQIRMLSATIQGLTFANNCNNSVRALPSGMAFASSIKEKKAKFIVIYQFMKNLLLASAFSKNDNDCDSLELVSSEDANTLASKLRDFDKIIICGEFKDIGKIKTAHDHNKIIHVEKYPIHGLLDLNSNFWQRQSLTQLIYARPAAKLPQNSF